MNKKTVWIGLAILLMIALFLVTLSDLDRSVRKPTNMYNELDDPKLYRIIYITEELESPMWAAIKQGALSAAEAAKPSEFKVAVDFRGTFRPNVTEFLKTMDIAIASHVSGIIVQGVNHPDFIRMVNKATTKGIPVMTIVADSPESLRKTYVGSDHVAEGTLIAQEVVKRLGTRGKLAVISGAQDETYQTMREQGIEQVLGNYPDIRIFRVERSSRQSYAVDWEANEILNRCPDCKTFLALGPDTGAEMAGAIRNRAKPEDYAIFTFDDNPKTMNLVRSGLIDATLKHNPEEMGKMSMLLMLRWLDGKRIPLERFHYTPTQIVSE